MSKRTHYQVLGVQPDAEDLVIKAAYRALAQRYHPDKWDGDKAMAQQRMAEINAAYAVLSDAVKRREYDAELKSTGSDQQFADDTNQDDEFADYFNEKEDDWQFATQFFPEVIGQYDRLKNINVGLSHEFKILLLETKDFKRSGEIFERMRRDFLVRHFGEDKGVLILVNQLIRLNNRQALLDINRAVRVLGQSFDLKTVASQFADKWQVSKYMIECVAENRVLEDRGKIPFGPIPKTNTYESTKASYFCANCGKTGSLIVKKDMGFFADSFFYICPQCGNTQKA